MDWLTFIADIVKATAWPAAIVVTVLILRDPLFRLLRELKRLKWKDVELEFENAVREVKAKFPFARRPSGELQQEIDSRLLDLLQISPKAAVLDAWVEVERETSNLLRRREVDIPGHLSAVQRVDLLRRRELLDDHSFWLFSSLRQLRNRAAHEHEAEIPEEGALDFIMMASDLLRYLKEK